jgi:hypothetical protein
MDSILYIIFGTAGRVGLIVDLPLFRGELCVLNRTVGLHEYNMKSAGRKSSV